MARAALAPDFRYIDEFMTAPLEAANSDPGVIRHWHMLIFIGAN